MIDCYYRRLDTDGDVLVFESTDGTRSNWDPEIQHGSPPLALMTKLIEELAAGSGLRIGRLTLDILGAIAVTASTINVVGGFLITDRMLKMFKGREKGAAR